MPRRTLDELAAVDLNALSASENARFAVEGELSLRELEEAERRSQGRQNGRRLWRAMVLSPNIAICEALLAGQKVPRERLDSKWLKRFPT